MRAPSLVRASSLLVLAVWASACASGEALDPIEIVVDSSGELHLLARRAIISGHAEIGGPVSFRYAEQRDGRWGVQPAWSSEMGWVGYGPPVYRLLADDDGRVTIVAGEPNGVRMLTRAEGASWETIPVDPGLPDDALGALADGDLLGGAWLGASSELRVLAGDWLLESVDGTIARATRTGATCDPFTVQFSECHFVPTGDRAGEAIVFRATFGGGGTFDVRRLDCEADACTWSDVVDHGLGTPGPLGNTWESRIALRDLRGTTFVVHRLSGFGAGPNVRVAGGGRAAVLPGFVYRFGAAAHPSGGLVVVTSTYYDDVLTLHLVTDAAEDPAALDVTSFALGVLSLRGSPRLGVLVPPVTPGESERAHIVLARTESGVTRLVVDLATRETMREDFDL
ncbi:MAG: hypothetical protein M3Y87_06365 [Myxococcota bacterium]|nr:hypothetical protein [Myxococcota bacterium]